MLLVIFLKWWNAECSSRSCGMKRVQWVWRLMDRKNDDRVVKVLKKSVECTKVLSARAKEIKAAKKVKFIQDCCGLWRREAMKCAILYWLGGRPSCLECVRARICTELKSVSKPEKIQHCYEPWLWPSHCSSRTDPHADHEEASHLPQTFKTLHNN
jgi:hypothetical protein